MTAADCKGWPGRGRWEPTAGGAAAPQQDKKQAERGPEAPSSDLGDTIPTGKMAGGDIHPTCFPRPPICMARKADPVDWTNQKAVETGLKSAR
jgi:hypothetical protein